MMPPQPNQGVAAGIVNRNAIALRFNSIRNTAVVLRKHGGEGVNHHTFVRGSTHAPYLLARLLGSNPWRIAIPIPKPDSR